MKFGKIYRPTDIWLCMENGVYRKAVPHLTGSVAVLTAREREVLELLAKGLAYKQVADTLLISQNTANNHLRNIREKLGAHNTIEAINKMRLWPTQGKKRGKGIFRAARSQDDAERCTQSAHHGVWRGMANVLCTHGVPHQRSLVPVLTAREHEVLELLARGLAYKQIADALAISPNTINNHLRKIREKLGAHNSVEAINKTRLWPSRKKSKATA